jgi:hypothetical protein
MVWQVIKIFHSRISWFFLKKFFIVFLKYKIVFTTGVIVMELTMDVRFVNIIFDIQDSFVNI